MLMQYDKNLHFQNFVKKEYGIFFEDQTRLI